MKASAWIIRTDCSFRVVEGSDPECIPNRLAFIEKTPRVRVRPAWITERNEDHWNWAEAPFKGSGPDDSHSREWCDAMLKLLGHDLM
jgi:hypothetical protein